MKILLLGANGQLGSDIIREQAKHAEFQLEAWGRSQLDITQLDSIESRLSNAHFDVLINCTSYHRTDEAENNANLAMAVNAHAVKKMALACKQKGARFIHISTDYVFGGYVPQHPLDESAATAPVNVYGASKALGETFAKLAYEDTIILRVASLFGVSGASGKGGNFVETMLRLGKERGEVKVVADQMMSPTATADIAWMIFALLKANVPAGIYHAVNSGQASWYEFTCEIFRQVGLNATVHPIPASSYPVPAMRPAYSVLSNQNISRYIGPISHWQEALNRYLIAKGHATYHQYA